MTDKYKGIPLHQWKNPRLLMRLTDEEMLELYRLLYSYTIDRVDQMIDGGHDLSDANQVIRKVMNK